MMQRWSFSQFFTPLMCVMFLIRVASSLEGEVAESKAFFGFVKGDDPQNLLNVSWNETVSSPCQRSTAKQRSAHKYVLRKLLAEAPNPNPSSLGASESKKGDSKGLQNTVPLVLTIGFFTLILVLGYLVKKKLSASSEEKNVLETLALSPQKPLPAETMPEPNPVRTLPELVFFVGEEEQFKLDDLFEATADLRSQTLCSSLYKVVLKNKIAYAVKRLKTQVSSEEFSRTMKQVGQMKHPNILPLVGYNSSKEEKLLIYKYQNNGSLLNLLEDYIAGKKEFPWKLRLSIASGIARGLDFIYRNPDEHEIIPHGNLKLSNILLDENLEPLISEYGFSAFLDPRKSFSHSFSYTAPEKTLSEKGDVFSFGIIMLELLTGKMVENSGIDLPKWVKAMVKEEWTGEVFDREVKEAARHNAFPLLNISLKCVSQLAQDRPTMAELLEKIEEVVHAHEDISISSMASRESNATARDFFLLRSIISEAWDTPGSNY